MQYLCLVYECDGPDTSNPDFLNNPVVREVFDHRETLMANGRLIASSPLEAAETAVTVKVRDGKAAVTDGPFVETKEQVGGFYLIEAVDLAEAVNLAKTMPPARFGAIEVRALKQLGPAG